MKTFNFKQRNLFAGPHLLGTLLIFAGLFALISPSFLEIGSSVERALAVGIGAAAVDLLIISTYGGTMVDPTQKRFKEYSSVCGYKHGKWMPLPDISKIKVISTSYLNSNTPNGISPTLSGKVTDFKTLLFSNSPEPVLSFKYSNQNKAIKHAKRLAAALNAELILTLPN